MTTACQNIVTGLVIASHGHHCTVQLNDGKQLHCYPRGKRAGPVVGDKVDVLLEGQSEGVINHIYERKNQLFRSDENRTKHFATNIDLLLLVVAPQPSFSNDLISRALVASKHANIQPAIILNKADLAKHLPAARKQLAPFIKLDTPVIELSALNAENTYKTLSPWLKNKTSLLLGQSGMGKSTILNALIPEANAPTQAHSEALDAGRHTTTGTRLYRLNDINAQLIDSPGFQNFGLYHLSAAEIEDSFTEFTPLQGNCRFYNCTHQHEPGCAVLAALNAGEICPQRHRLYQRLLQENAQTRY